MEQEPRQVEPYEAPRAEVVRVEASAQCLETSVPIDNNPNPGGGFDPSDIG